MGPARSKPGSCVCTVIASSDPQAVRISTRPSSDHIIMLSSSASFNICLRPLSQSCNFLVCCIRIVAYQKRQSAQLQSANGAKVSSTGTETRDVMYATDQGQLTHHWQRKNNLDAYREHSHGIKRTRGKECYITFSFSLSLSMSTKGQTGHQPWG
jgi:hypothetical protein